MSFLKSLWKTNSKHKKLAEEWAMQNTKDCYDCNDSENLHQDQVEPAETDVVNFQLKYLGSTLVEDEKGATIVAVKTILKAAKSAGKKIQRVNVAVSLKGIAVTDSQGKEMFEISIYRISNCSANSAHIGVFSFMATNQNETMECHAFLCSKRKKAELVTLTVARAFSTAYEAWQVMPPTIKSLQEKQKLPEKEDIQIIENQLIDFGFDDRSSTANNEINSSFDVTAANNADNSWVSFDDEFDNLSRWRNYNQSQTNDLILS